MKNFQALGNYLKEARLRRNISQVDLAVHLGLATSQFISNWERGIAAPPLKTAKKLSKILGVPKKRLQEMYLDIQKQHIKSYLG